MTDEASELELLARRASAGDRDALEKLLRRLRPLAVRTARLIMGARSWSAEDAAQEAMIDVSQGIGKLREPGSVRTWALRIATRRALRTARREQLLGILPWRDTDIPAQELGPVDERQALLMDAIGALPPGQRAVLVLRLHSGLSEAETAEVLGVSAGTVKSQLHDARLRLTTRLRDEGMAVPVSSAEKGAVIS